MGRTGTLFAYEQAGAVPDVMALAKALGGGVPIGALCATERAAAAFTPGAHGTTFGGNPLTCAAALAALRTIAEPAFLDHVAAMGRRLRAGLDALAARHGRITLVRGLGLMQGLVLDGPGGDVVGALPRRRSARQLHRRAGDPHHAAAGDHGRRDRPGPRHPRRRARGDCMKRDLLRLADLSTAELEAILDLAARLKADQRGHRPHPLLSGHTLAMIFEKPSLRTRVTFEVGMVQLGGAAVNLAPGRHPARRARAGARHRAQPGRAGSI